MYSTWNMEDWIGSISSQSQKLIKSAEVVKLSIKRAIIKICIQRINNNHLQKYKKQLSIIQFNDQSLSASKTTSIWIKEQNLAQDRSWQQEEIYWLLVQCIRNKGEQSRRWHHKSLERNIKKVYLNSNKSKIQTFDFKKRKRVTFMLKLGFGSKASQVRYWKPLPEAENQTSKSLFWPKKKQKLHSSV